ncbi:MAG: hypothetical protein WD767_05290 [Alphaproteobacteria bacterium]
MSANAALRPSRKCLKPRFLPKQVPPRGVIISATSAERAIFTRDALARRLEEVGLFMTMTAGGDKMSVQKDADRVRFILLERTKRVKYNPTPEEVAREERRKENQVRSCLRNDWDSNSFGSRPGHALAPATMRRKVVNG